MPLDERSAQLVLADNSNTQIARAPKGYASVWERTLTFLAYRSPYSQKDEEREELFIEDLLHTR